MRYLITPPALCEQAARTGTALAHAAFRLGGDGWLHTAALPRGVRGGVMVLGEGERPMRGDVRGLVRALSSVCTARGFSGILCDFEPPVSPFLAQVVGGMLQTGKTVWVHEGYAAAARGARVLIPSLLSGGSLAGRLSTAAAKHGPRLALAVQHTRLEFTLPAPDGTGTPLTECELLQLKRRHSPTVFYSPELCVQYFTYRTQNGGAKLVLFDDAHSTRQKLELAGIHGVKDAFLVFEDAEEGGDKPQP